MNREPVTPWNPSRRATAHVTNPLPVPTECHIGWFDVAQCDAVVAAVAAKAVQ